MMQPCLIFLHLISVFGRGQALCADFHTPWLRAVLLHGLQVGGQGSAIVPSKATCCYVGAVHGAKCCGCDACVYVRCACALLPYAPAVCALCVLCFTKLSCLVKGQCTNTERSEWTVTGSEHTLKPSAQTVNGSGRSVADSVLPVGVAAELFDDRSDGRVAHCVAVNLVVQHALHVPCTCFMVSACWSHRQTDRRTARCRLRPPPPTCCFVDKKG